MNWISWVGVAASLATCIQFIPQVMRIWGQRNDRAALAAFSIPTTAPIVLNATLWFVYGSARGEAVIAVPNALCLASLFFTVCIVLRGRRLPTAPVTEAPSGDMTTPNR